MKNLQNDGSDYTQTAQQTGEIQVLQLGIYTRQQVSGVA